MRAASISFITVVIPRVHNAFILKELIRTSAQNHHFSDGKILYGLMMEKLRSIKAAFGETAMLTDRAFE